MHVKCLCCGAVASLDLLLAGEEGVLDVVKVVGEMQPELWSLVFQYIGLFRPEKGKLSWVRAAKILGELHDMVKSEQFERGGKVFSAPLVVWLAGIDQILSKRLDINRPLKTHGYLLEIMMSLDAKSIKDMEKKKATPTPNPQPTTHHHDEPSKFLEPPKDTMTKEEGFKALADLGQRLGVKLPNRQVKTQENADLATQQAQAEMQRLLDQEQAQRNQQFKR